MKNNFKKSMKPKAGSFSRLVKLPSRKLIRKERKYKVITSLMTEVITLPSYKY